MPSILHTKQGGTGSNSVPLENQIPIGDSNGNYQPGDISSVGFLLQTNIGVVQLPTVTKNIDGTITVGDDGIINLCDQADGRGNIKQFSNIIGDTLTPVDNAINFLYADYNSGSPIYKISTTNQIFLTDNTLVPVVRISRYGNRLHFEEYDEYATLTANKLVLKDVILNGARRLSGLTLSTEATRKSIVSAGQGVFSLQYYLNLEENRAGITGSIYELYPTAGVWGENLVTEYDSSYYSDGTNRIALGNNKYVAKYFWRDIGDDNEVYYIHGQQYNTESQAFNENVPVAPFFMTGHSLYVGKIVIQKNATNGTAYSRNWEGSVQSATVSNHNDLSGIQGGTANEYYHLTYSQSTDLTGGGVSTLHKHTALSTPDGTSNFVYTDNSGKLHVDGDIIQNGSAYETHAEQVYTKKDLIITRDGAISGLGVGEYTGFQAKLYDGVNDGQLIFDKDGWAKVGDIGNLVTLAGREDSPIDQAFGYWDDATKIFKTKTISSSDLTDNSSIVKTSGTQTIEGAKTFSDTIIGSINGNLTGNVTGNADTADKWKTARNITISDADGTNTGAAVSVDGSENETLKLPATIKANVTGNAGTATLATQANAIKPLGNFIVLPATPTSVTKIIKIATVDWNYKGSINIICTGAAIEDGIKVYINGGAALAAGIRVIYGKNNVTYGIKKIIVALDTPIYSSSRNIYAEITTYLNNGSTTTLGIVETNRGTFTPSMTEVSSVDGTVVDSLSLDYLRGDISSYQHVFTKNIIGNVTGNADTASTADKIPFATKTGTSTGTRGQASFDNSYLYLCTATNVWKRVALTSF